MSQSLLSKYKLYYEYSESEKVFERLMREVKKLNSRRKEKKNDR